jgi:integrase
MRNHARRGTDPIHDRQAARDALKAAQANRVTFAQAADEFLAAKGEEWRNPKHRKQWASTLQTYAGPVIGSMAVDAVEKLDILRVLQPVWKEKPETASRVRQRIERVLDYAKTIGARSGDNPARWRGNLEHALSKIPKPDSQPRLDYKQLPEFVSQLKTIDSMPARMLEFAILIGGRPGAARLARWDQIDFENQLFFIEDAEPGFKSYRETQLVLNDEVIALLRNIQTFDSCPHVFASPRKKAYADTYPNCVIKNTMHPEKKSIDGIGWVDNKQGRRIVVHGFRSSFKDWARECTTYPDEVHELQLMHGKADKTRDAYARSALIDLRRRLMADWATFLLSP